MRIEELIIDGFKSYAVRTVITNWDSQFNAITGLNGSGKSNILDSICFVLGITNMSTVRAANLQDLIYKRGQAGITKAGVTIVFDNKDKKNSPIGFEEYSQISVTRQVVMGGQSKYLINGHRAQQHTVQNLFQSVQLNINNPNFLIMQGKITKVLNMKPVEILAMIEEAAGTRMFEDRKDKAFKTMAKKDKKVEEINSLLAEEIEPKLDKLRNEKRAFLEFQQTQSDLERLTKLVIAHDYLKFRDRVNRSGADLKDKKNKLRAIEESITQKRSEISHIEKDVQRVTQERERELQKGGRFQELEAKVKEASHELVRINTVVELQQSTIAEEETRIQKSKEAKRLLTESLQQKTHEYEQIKTTFEKLKSDSDIQQRQVSSKEELLQTLITGVAAKEGHDAGYMDQLQEAKTRISTAQTEFEQVRLKISHLEKQVQADEPRAKKAREQNISALRELEAHRNEANRLETELRNLGWNEESQRASLLRKRELETTITEQSQIAANFRRKAANIDFIYSDPTPNFDRSKVKGLVAQLFSLPQDKFKAATALEICAGGRLFNVVVENEVIGTQLLEKGNLRKRVTIIPLNRISALMASAEKVGAARKLSPGKVDLALHMVGYESEVAAAMEYVFGSTLICEDAETAKTATFNPSVRLKSVTLEGDVYDPSGTLSGGSSISSSGLLIHLQKLNEITRDIDVCKKELDSLNRQMNFNGEKNKEARELKKKLDLKRHELVLREEQINSNSHSKLINEVEEMKKQIEELKVVLAEAKNKGDEALRNVAKIEKDMSEFKDNKDGKLKELEEEVEQLKASISKKSTHVKECKREFQKIQLEAEQMGADLAGAQEQLDDANSTLQVQQSELQSLLKDRLSIKEQYDLVSAEMDNERAKMVNFDDELKSLEEAARKKTSEITESGLSLQKLRHEVEKFDKELQGVEGLLAQMEREHEWIADEKSNFGRQGTPYYFANQDISECKNNLKSVTERFKSMQKKVNATVMNMIDSVEKKEASLKTMLKTVQRDKRKIEETICTLDEYKKEALQRTWEKVNRDFGQIFAELLPGNFAKLEPAENKSISDGLEVRVCIGKIWKQSLTELSGGQRSLIALALIMSLLEFKPAPMYILDEVDAALDLSHTQNIGRLIKTRFKGSQFIVVSLKEGMFSNANRIYRTRFVDGTSVVLQS